MTGGTPLELGVRRELGAGQQLALDGSCLVVRVLSGSLIVLVSFKVRGEAVYRRVITLQGGGAAFSFRTGHPGGVALTGVAGTDVELCAEPFPATAEDLEDPRHRADLEAFLHAFYSLVPAPGRCSCSAAQSVDVGPHERWRPADPGLVWAEVERGAVWLVARLRVREGAGTLLARGAWVEGDVDAVINLRRYPAEREPQVLQAGITRALVATVEGIAAAERQARELAESAAMRRAQHADQARKDALRGLARVLVDLPRDAEQSGHPLVRVVATIARELGVPTPRVAIPAEAERLQDPVGPVAAAFGLRHRSIVFEPGWWRKDCGPLLGWLDGRRQPVALLPAQGSGYRCVDPTEGTSVSITAELAGRLNTGVTFYASMDARPTRPMALLGAAARGRKVDLWQVAGWGLAASAAGLLMPTALGLILGRAAPDGDLSLVVQLGVGLGAAAVGALVFDLTQGQVLSRLETILSSRAHAGMVDRLLAVGLPFHRRFQAGDLVSRVYAIEQLRAGLAGTVIRTLVSSTFALLNLSVMIFYSPLLSGPAVLLAGGIGVATAVGARQVVGRARVQGELQGRLSGLTVQLIGGIAKLRVAGAEERAFAKWAELFQRQVHVRNQIQRAVDRAALLTTLAPVVGTLGLFALATSLVVGEQAALGVGDFLAFQAAFGMFLAGASELSRVVMDVVDLDAQVDRLRPLLDEHAETSDGAADPGPLTGRFELSGVRFGYRSDQPPVLDDVSIAVNPGDFVAIVGPSGSGKSTLLRLLLGFEQPQDGAVLFDGRDLRRLDVRAVRRRLGVVMQSTRITAGTILDTILGGTQASLDEAWDAAKAGGIDSDIRAMPMAMHTILSEGGANISGGQRQRLLIARALLRKPSILLFDEATSALDAPTQAEVSQRLDALDVTRLVIAHRLSTVRGADRIYVLAGGRVVEQGRFDELAQAGGLFSELLARQRT